MEARPVKKLDTNAEREQRPAQELLNARVKESTDGGSLIRIPASVSRATLVVAKNTIFSNQAENMSHWIAVCKCVTLNAALGTSETLNLFVKVLIERLLVQMEMAVSTRQSKCDSVQMIQKLLLRLVTQRANRKHQNSIMIQPSPNIAVISSALSAELIK